MHSFLFVGNHKSQPTQDYSRTSNIVCKEKKDTEKIISFIIILVE
jgi:hypothetical protein